jgi:hypothetical protein
MHMCKQIADLLNKRITLHAVRTLALDGSALLWVFWMIAPRLLEE